MAVTLDDTKRNAIASKLADESDSRAAYFC